MKSIRPLASLVLLLLVGADHAFAQQPPTPQRPPIIDMHILRGDSHDRSGFSEARSSPLQPIGLALCGLGLVVASYFFLGFDTSVEVPSSEVAGQTVGGGRVNNIGLLTQRQNGIMIAAVVAIIGIVLFVAGRGGDAGGRVAGDPRRVAGGLECPNCRRVCFLRSESAMTLNVGLQPTAAGGIMSRG